MQVAGDVLQSHVGDPGAPGQVQAPQLAQVLRHQLHAVVCDLGAAGEAEGGEVGEAVHHVDHAVVGDLPARVQPQGVGGIALEQQRTSSVSLLTNPIQYKDTPGTDLLETGIDLI